MKTQLLQDFAESGSAPAAAADLPRPHAPALDDALAQADRAGAGSASAALTAAAAAAPDAARAAGLEQPAQARRRGVADLLLQRATDAAQFDAARSHQRAPAGSAGGAPSPALPGAYAEPQLQARAQTEQRAQVQPAFGQMVQAPAVSPIERARGAVPMPADPVRDASLAPQGPAASAPPQGIQAQAGTAPAAPPLPAAGADATFFAASAEAGGTADAAAAAPDAPAVPDELPAWLSERLRADGERDAKGERRRRWMRRALAAGAAAASLALLAGVGWWVYQDNQVDGALTVVASTRAPAQSGAGGLAGAHAPDAVTTGQDAAPKPAPPAGAAPATDTLAAAADATGAAPAADDMAQAVTGPASEVIGPVQRAVKRRPAPESSPSEPASRTRGGAEAASSHRREETLMQCRALGYDEQQCLRRGCAMTRFGLACRG